MIIKNGAKKLIVIGDKEIAYNLKKGNSDYILIGERGGIKLPKFDYGNSPSQIEKIFAIIWAVSFFICSFSKIISS